MITIYICDDEPQLIKQLHRIIQDQITIFNFDMGPIQTSSNPDELIDNVIASASRAIYFLDIDFPGYENGFDLALKIRKHDPRGFIIFITAHDDLAIETFRYRLEVMDYIVKGDEASLKKRIQSCLQSIEQRITDESAESNHYFSLKLMDTLRHIPMDQILYFEAIGRKHQVRLHMIDEVIDFYSSLQQLEEELYDGFWRCHRSFLINISHIKQIRLAANDILLDNQEICLLSRRAKQSMPDRLSATVHVIK